jgi:tRNA(Arg) A34 adenosine deaminase TadA
LEQGCLFMKEALKEAKKAYNKDETPVGAVIVKDGIIIAQAHNEKWGNSNKFRYFYTLLHTAIFTNKNSGA